MFIPELRDYISEFKSNLNQNLTQISHNNNSKTNRSYNTNAHNLLNSPLRSIIPN
jgi:hypothetical protein